MSVNRKNKITKVRGSNLYAFLVVYCVLYYLVQSRLHHYAL
jgi:hypothetical protein